MQQNPVDAASLKRRLSRFRRARTAAASRFAAIGLCPAVLVLAFHPPVSAQQNVATGSGASPCAETGTGITLPPGFCATVFADDLGHARHLVVTPDGGVYVNTWSGRYYGNTPPPPGGFLIALKDTTSDGHADVVARFGPDAASGNAGGTGIASHDGALYAETNDRIVRYVLTQGDLVPTAPPEVIVSGLPLTGDHPMHPFAIDAQGALYVNLGSATNACQVKNRMAESRGIEPCTELETRAGIWRYDANRTGQTFSPAERYATGLRNAVGIAIDAAGRIYATQHGRDQLAQNWPERYTQEQGANEPAEELVQLERGADFGWPYCYFDLDAQKLVLAPEYGGDGKAVGPCAEKRAPIASFPAHWAPNALVIYEGRQFPNAYHGGAFIAFHGSWNRAPLPQGGYNVVFQPLADGQASAPYAIFADSFAGPVENPGKALHRPAGLAVGPDGALYISDDQHGRIWRVTYHGPMTAGIAAAVVSTAPPASSTPAASPLEGVHPDAGTQSQRALPTPPGATPAEVELGSRIYLSQAGNAPCAGCHGSNGEGTPLGPDLSAGTWLWSDGSVQSIATIIRDGVPQPKNFRGSMPPLGGAQLSPAEVDALAAYVWAIGHRDRK
jgi:glucose/arabinose dehydrogenase/mono/diheme cytochrome c family protein